MNTARRLTAAMISRYWPRTSAPHDRAIAAWTKKISPAPVALGLVALVLGNVALVPRYGLMGAAIAASLAMVLWSAAQWLVALKHTGTDVSIWPRLREALGGPRLP